MPDHCTGPECTRPTVAHGLCSGHYAQAKRLRPLKPLREPSDRAQVSFRCSLELKSEVEADAKRLGIDPAEWWRRAGARALKGGKR